MKLTEALSTEELKSFLEYQDWRSTLSVVISWGLVVFSFALVDVFPNIGLVAPYPTTPTSLARNLAGPILVKSAMLLTLFLLGNPYLYLLWVGAYMTSFNLFLRIRAIAEHACTPDSTDPLNSTRTTYANALAKLTVAPHNINYHLDHHLLMRVPHYKLPKFHGALKNSGMLDTACVEPGYLAVLKKAAKTS
ncbi:MAG: fatty acid desaturase [Bdellovibrionota bacterium]